LSAGTLFVIDEIAETRFCLVLEICLALLYGMDGLPALSGAYLIGRVVTVVMVGVSALVVSWIFFEGH